MDSPDLALVQACEQRIVNAWPAVDTLVMEGWVVRLAGGYSGRANSASAIVAGARLDAPLLEAITGLFRRAGLAPCVRLTPLADASVEPFIAARGFALRDASIGMIAGLDAGGLPVPAGLRLGIAPAATADWVRGVSALQEGSKRDADAALMAIVGRVRLSAGFATLRDGAGRAIGFGMCVIERGMAELGSIIIAPEMRGRGAGRLLVRGMMDFAAQAGAGQAYLQVEQGNLPAFNLYRSLGFSEVYRYRTLVQRG